ncbi:HAD hydrolase-like protein [Solibacillus sp. MA9]|uniref:HAD hydrolase-like protein n=1 Tax=Solibacillus palustris TaxID=2908203 RepID=A0ABS9UFD7_9BACL|nr:HAD hydrolase-like protein [Solibacillus sp. MA9]MCH7322645.1 HAD hydrolase-like protein [Solibacillus sp. MA9]
MNIAIIFDMDGTLFQTNRILEPALEVTFQQLREMELWEGITPIEKYRDIMGVPLTVVWETLCPQHTDEMRENTNRIFQSALIKLIENGNGALYEGIEYTLEKLEQDYPLFIASNGQTAYLQAIVEYYQLSRWIKGVYSIDRIASGNKSELVALVIKEHSIKQGFVIGDRASDIKAAADNQLTSIGVDFDFAQENELQKADFVVKRFEEINTIVKDKTS